VILGHVGRLRRTVMLGRCRWCAFGLQQLRTVARYSLGSAGWALSWWARPVFAVDGEQV